MISKGVLFTGVSISREVINWLSSFLLLSRKLQRAKRRVIEDRKCLVRSGVLVICGFKNVYTLNYG
jgi:hypothetical protein